VTAYRVVIAARAERQVQLIAEWWSTHRPSAPALFLDELTEALSRLAAAPLSGSPYAVGKPKGVRRVLLRRSRYHVYFTVNDRDELVAVRAVWHSARGGAPNLG
jgi:plasmid stabilization system protein ParE